MRYRISVDTGGTFTDVVVMTGSVYGVILAGRIEDKSLTVDDDRTGSLRQEMSAASQTRDRFWQGFSHHWTALPTLKVRLL
jgi:N-methylhydantoinase A/oxoprolinase/acetone carboxylase beta subunit